MNNRKINIEEIKLLIPDYVTGSLNEKEKKIVEDAMRDSKELQKFYNDVKNTLQFVETVKFEEPVPQYWNNLLPRIHQRIEEREQKQLLGFKKPLSIAWKILLPAAAVILIFIIYRIATTPVTQYTVKEKVIKTDTNAANEKNLVPVPKENIIQERKSTAKNLEPLPHKVHKKRSFEENRSELNEEYAVENKQPKEENIFSSELFSEEDTTAGLSANQEYSNLVLRDTQIFSEAQPGIFDEEMENEIDRLTNNEKDRLLNDLENTNL